MTIRSKLDMAGTTFLTLTNDYIRTFLRLNFEVLFLLAALSHGKFLSKGCLVYTSQTLYDIEKIVPGEALLKRTVKVSESARLTLLP